MKHLSLAPCAVCLLLALLSFPSNLRAQGLIDEVKLMLPVGVVLPYAGIELPQNQEDAWLICDGRALNTNVYPELFAALLYTYGGEGETFLLPDLRGRVPVGKVDMGRADAAETLTEKGKEKHKVDGKLLGAVGGAETHILERLEMPKHSHSVLGTTETARSFGKVRITHQLGTQTSEDHIVGWGGGGYTEIAHHQVNIPGGRHTHSIDLVSKESGEDQPHSNLQPSIILNYIIRAKTGASK